VQLLHLSDQRFTLVGRHGLDIEIRRLPRIRGGA